MENQNEEVTGPQTSAEKKVRVPQAETDSNKIVDTEQEKIKIVISDSAQKKLNELDEINNSMNLVAGNLEELHKKLIDLNLKIKRTAISLHTVDSIVKLNEDLIKKETALKEIKSSLVKRFFGFFTKKKLKKEIATINTTLNSCVIKLSPVDIKKLKKKLRRELKEYKNESVAIGESIKENCNKLREGIQDKVTSFQNGLSVNINPFVSFGLNRLIKELNRNIAEGEKTKTLVEPVRKLAEETVKSLVKGKNKKKRMDALTIGASKKAQGLSLEGIPSRLDQQVSRA